MLRNPVNYLKSAVTPIFKFNTSRYELDLSNEVLYTLVGQEAAKISEVKVEGQKRISTD